MLVDSGVDGIGKVGDRKYLFVGVAYGDVKMGVTVFVSVLVAHIGKYGTLSTVFENIDALVEPSLLDFESVLGVIRNIDCLAFVFNFDFADFDTVDFFGRIFFCGCRIAICG